MNYALTRGTLYTTTFSNKKLSPEETDQVL